VVLALSTGQELGLAAVAAVFIAFALVSAFVLPGRNPNFPGRWLWLFVLITALLFVAMIAAILVLAREGEEEAGHETGPAATETQPETETATATETATQAEPPVQGDAEAGKEVFASMACAGCHVLAAAGASGTVGPNLDETAPEYERIVTQVTNGGGGMPAFGDQLSEEEIQDVAAFVYESTR
jgi:mono/diheme cytochrome c family protein